MTQTSIKEHMIAGWKRLSGQGRAFWALFKQRRVIIKQQSDKPVINHPNWQLLAVVTVSLILMGFLFLDQAAGVWKSTVPPVTHKLFRLYTDLGKSEVVLIPAALAILALGVLNWKALRVAQQAALMRVQMLGLFLFVAIAGSGLTNNLLKIMIGRARPRHFDELGPMTFDPPGLSSSFQGFPSGHSATAGALAIILILLIPRLKWTWIGLTAWIAISRVVVGSHYPADIVAGFAYGAAFTWLLAAWMARHRLYFRVIDGSIDVPNQLSLSATSLYKSLSLLRQKAYDKASNKSAQGED